MGLATGLGFAVVQIGLAPAISADDGIGAWVVYGFGTGMLHGGTAAAFALVAKYRFDRFAGGGLSFLIALAAAFALRVVFLFLPLSELAVAAIALVLFPALIWIAFLRSRVATQEWLGRQFDVAVPVCAEPQIRGGSDTALGSRSWWWLAAFGHLKEQVLHAPERAAV